MKHEYYDVELAVSYRIKVTVLASDEDDAFDAAVQEAEFAIPDDAYHVGVDSEDITLNIDGDDYDEYAER